MKFKLDENFGQRTVKIFKEAGYEVHTIHDEGLAGAPDLHIYEVCKRERRCLITLDLDFSDVTRFPPQATGGIIVFACQETQRCPLLKC